ncbi:MAG: universal stress protein [Chloroflexi bacterium]|nr:universal stress protein [Chloroflexota bacterium]
MYDRVLVPLDGSTLSERALAPALALVTKPSGEVMLLRALLAEAMLVRGIEGVDPYVESWAVERRDADRKESAEYLAALQNANRRDDLALHTRVVEGDVSEAILLAAQAADLIVMSTHGYSGLTRWVLGSVTERVLSAAPCPVLVVRQSQPMHKVLIALDGSDLSETAIAPGIEAAVRLGCKASLLRVVDEITGFERAQLGLGDTDIANRLQEGLMKEAQTYLGSLVLPALQESHREVVVGSAAHTILDYAQAHEIDLIVMATHGRTGLSKWVYGSVTEKVLRGAHCNMLVVRPAAHRLR